VATARCRVLKTGAISIPRLAKVGGYATAPLFTRSCHAAHSSRAFKGEIVNLDFAEAKKQAAAGAVEILEPRETLNGSNG
jgi:hypothetical protein